MRQLEDLKISGSQSPVNKENISWLESKIKYRLPSSYSYFLLKYNGGCPELDTYSNNKGEWAINNFFHLHNNLSLAKDSNSTEDILWNYNHKWKDAKKSLLPFAKDGGGNLFCLDMEGNEKHPIIFWSHEAPNPDGIIIAEDFEGFINNLHINPDYI